MSASAASASHAARWQGQSVARAEDGRLLRGLGRFVDDAGMHRQGYVHFVRSPHAHARILDVDTSRAEELDGVFATLTGAEAAAETQPFMQLAPGAAHNLQEFCLAVDKVRYAGDAVAAVLAATPALARDAAELVRVRYDPLDAIVDAPTACNPDAPVLHESVGTNVSWSGLFEYGDIDWALEKADHVLRIPHLHFHRFSSTPLEPLGAIVHWEPGTDMLRVRSNAQMPGFTALMTCEALGLRVDQTDFESQDVGGGFGIKMALHPSVTAMALLSLRSGRPAKWIEQRSEHMASAGQGSERTFLDAQVPVLADGTILGFSVRAVDDAGGYLHYEPLGSVIWSQALTGCYQMRHVRVEFTQALTNKCPTVPNRGYSKMQQIWFVERVVDGAAHRLGFDPVDLRRRNYVQPDQYPYETPNGCVYDSGDLPASLDRALELIDYDQVRAEQRRRRPEVGGRRLGIGIGSTLDPGTNNFGQARLINPALPFSGNAEAATVRLDLDGGVGVALGTVPQGQSHETTAAQVVADELGITPIDVHVTVGFRQAQNTYVGQSGTYASQFAVTGLGAVQRAAVRLADEIRQVGAAVLDAPTEELELREGAVGIVGDSERRVPLARIANLVLSNALELDPDLADRITLNCRAVYRPPFELPDGDRKFGNLALTYATQVHACVVELDEHTGRVKILAYSAVDDCGRRINPQVVEGQVHGAIGHGLGASLHEAILYSDDGLLLTSTFLDYHAATALDVPSIATAAVESPSPVTPLGAKGMGEGGGAPLSTLCAAVQDALGSDAPLVTDSHLSAEAVWRLMLSDHDDAGIEVVSR